MTEPTPEIVRAFFAHMVREFGVTLHQQGDPLSGPVSLWVSFTGMNPATTAITSFDHIIVPFRAGVRIEGAWSLWDQMSVLVHECQHVEQYRRGGILSLLDYVASSAKRAENEVRCMSASVELHHWRYRMIESWYPAASVGRLSAYGCSAKDIAVSEKHMRSIGASAKRGLVISRAASVAIAWLDQHAPELRHPSVPSRSPS